ncbi:hypothetical protein CBR_g6412 [Chara braunii]|uniref:Cationic amino acid transporter C-terminal domain-containing protein n=1 Tax=Chara braunii TaxID=69332 RepID=A0A388KJP6_CHABU|nr:hypothetical protein CBR_g6412 [Chara braunii]|eukprot:GBG70285.1 hypothetical protein CBR_g6412 [Chara braunii]
MESIESSSSLDALVTLVGSTPRRLKERSFLRKSATDLSESVGPSSGRMKRELNAFDTLMFGIGCIVGTGVFVVTGVAAKDNAGPAVIIAYLVAAVSSVLSALCYTEFAIEMPVAGGAFSYLLATFGEYPAYLTVANVLLEYMLGAAAVGRGFTSYGATLFNWQPNSLRIEVYGTYIDVLAALLVLLLTLLICYGTKDSSMFNIIVSLGNLAAIAVVIVIGITKGDIGNITNDFNPYGAEGVVDAAALVYFSFVGFDAVATLTEEVGNPSRDIPIGTVGSVIIVAVIYALMSVSLCMMMPYRSIDIDAPYPAALDFINCTWGKYVVAVGALMGILTSLLVLLIAQSRVVLVIGRSNLLPAALSRISLRWNTPVISTIVLGVITSFIALFMDLTSLSSMVSIGTLFVFIMVALALIYKRYYVPELETTSPHKVLLHILWIVASAFGVAISYHQTSAELNYLLPIFVVCWVTSTLSLQLTTRQQQIPPGFAVPLVPWIPSFSVLVNVFLITSLNRNAYIRVLAWSTLATLVYMFYGVHASLHADQLAEGYNVVGPVESGEVDPYTYSRLEGNKDDAHIPTITSREALS